MSNNEILKLVHTFVEKQYQMVIGTHGDHPWTATVYYSVDSSLNFYFLSSPETLHCQHIAINPLVSVNIAQSPQLPSLKKKGVQLYGFAEQIIGKQKVVHALSLWKQTLNVTNTNYSYEGMIKKLIDGRMYKITPKKIKFFNQELWQEGEEPIIELT